MSNPVIGHLDDDMFAYAPGATADDTSSSSADLYESDMAAKMAESGALAALDGEDEAGGDEPFQPVVATKNRRKQKTGAAAALNSFFLASAAPAVAKAAPVVDAAAGDTQDRLLKVVAKALARAVESQEDIETRLMDDSDVITAQIRYPFVWSGAAVPGAGAGLAPAAVSFPDREALAKIVGPRIDLDKPLYVRDVRIVDTSSTAPYPLGFVLKGIESKDSILGRSHKIDGTPVTWVVHQGHHTPSREHGLVHELSCESAAHAKLLMQHGNARQRDEVAAITFLPRSNNALVDPNTNIGRYMKANQHLIVADGKELLPMHSKMPLYLVPKDKAIVAAKKYTSEVLGKLPRTKFDKHTASVFRFDRPAAEAKTSAKFGDASDAAGLTPSGIQAANQASHAAYVTVEYRFVNPAKFS